MRIFQHPLSTTFHPRKLRLLSSGVITGGMLLFVSSTTVNAGNYLFNLILGRWLGPEVFAELSFVVTLVLMLTLVTITLQTAIARFAAMYTAKNDTAGLYALHHWASLWSWRIGGIIAIALILGAPFLQHFFHLTSMWPIWLIALGMPLYVAHGIDRGVLQGQARFGRLAVSYQVEMIIRFTGAIVLVALGWAINGAVIGLTLSFAGAWLVGWYMLRVNNPAGQLDLIPEQRKAVILFAGPVLVSLLGQILINNSDVLIVKHFFPAEEAGYYAALALIGRIVFFATWSVVTTIFPIVTQKHHRGEGHAILLGAALAIVAVISALIIGAALIIPEFIVQLLFGAEYLHIAPLLWCYATATALYALANVVITYHLALGNGRGSLFAAVAGVAQIALLWCFHDSLAQVVWVQIGLMSVLLVALLLWDSGIRLTAHKKHSKTQNVFSNSK